MKVVPLKDANLQKCVSAAKREDVVITQRGKPVAMLVGVAGLDLEQIELGRCEKFWKLVRRWRGQKTLSRAELDRRLSEK